MFRHSISNTKEGEGAVKNLVAQSLVERIIRAAKEGKKFKVTFSTTLSALD
jgi:hypothetical protein